MKGGPNPTHTAFPQTEAHVGSLVREAEIDTAALARPLRRCDLSVCRGTCCHDGVSLGPDEAAVLRRLADGRPGFFQGLGLDLPRSPVVGLDGAEKTAVRDEPMRATTPDFPPHFADTQCVFMLGDRRCALQVLSVEEGRHPYFYKPFTCWLHPLSLRRKDGGKPVLTVHSEATDPEQKPGYPGFASHTPCGQFCAPADGAPRAHESLDSELAMLETIGGRPLRQQIAAAAS